MNLHDQLKVFNVLTVIAIVVGLTLVFGLVFAAVGDKALDSVVSALEIFDASESWPTVVEAAKFPFFAAENFFDQFYLAFEQTMVIPEEHFTLVAGLFKNISEYSESLAVGGGAVIAQQTNYSGQILAFSHPRGKVLGLVIGDLNEDSGKIPDRRALSNSITDVRDGLRETSYSVPNFSALFSQLKSLILNLPTTP